MSAATTSPVTGLPFDPIAEAARHWRDHWGAETAPAVSAVTSLMRANQLLLARLNEALAPFELSFARYEALMLLFYSRSGELPLGKVGARLQVHPTGVTQLVDGLQRLALVERVAHPTDRRATLARITRRGREVAERATTELNGIAFGTAPLDPGDLESLTSVLEGFRLAAGDFAPGDNRPMDDDDHAEHR